MPKLGIVAGGGRLPHQIVAACRRLGRDFHVLAVKGSADDVLVQGVPADWIHIDRLSEALAIARREQIEELVLVGNVPRPSPGRLLRDPKSAKLLMKLGNSIFGDNDILSAVVTSLEQSEGFRVIAADELLTDSMASEGVHGQIEPDHMSRADIARGLTVAATLGSLDIGQAVIVQNGTVLGVEGVEGTDRLIERCSEYATRESPGGVLVKTSKPGQEQRADLPAVGVTTLERVGSAGLRGVAVEAGRSWIIDREAAIETADRLGVFLVGVGLPDDG